MPGPTPIDRESRIAARRARIAARLKAAKSFEQPVDYVMEGRNDDSHVNLVKSQGFATIFLKAQLKEKVLTLQNLANDRTFNQLHLNSTRYEDLRAFASKEEDFATDVAKNIQTRDTLLSINIPQQLFHKTNTLCEAYDNIVLSKEKVIGSMEAELKLKDEEYNFVINQHSHDVHALLLLMSQQATLLYDFYGKELDDLENKLLLQRKTLLSSNKSEMTTLIQERQDLESKYHDEIQACKEKFSQLLDDIREDDVEEFNALKIRLEKDAQNLEQHLQNMQAVYQLNAEKLEYNFLVLTEREHENYVMSNQQKKKLTKQRDALSNVKGRHHELEKLFLEHNEKLTDDYVRVTKLLQDLQKKEQNLQCIHSSMHRSFFFMHQHTIGALVSNVLQADKQIHEQELGWQWRYPSNNLFLRLGSRSPVKDSNKKKKVQNDSNINAHTLLESLSKDRYQPFIRALIKEATFLVDKESIKALVDLDPRLHNQAWSAIILNALGVDSSHALEKIFIFMTERMEDDEDMETAHLKAYVQGQKLLGISQVSNNGKDLQIGVLKEYQPAFKVGSQHYIQSMSNKLKWEGYWRSFTTVISPLVLRVWQHLDSALINYNQILKDR